ncbi:hypothetical protein AVEN_257951-1 [Araneus ventricosus]|uniref:Uncharacterized protein n=1 Tax=Araneus ventricosus TaxID=182803 RepID=A0A4Y2Q2X5_ARAVE|nr:hypothetical protein AVEN_257951-1 [Araneus ventricosus]
MLSFPACISTIRCVSFVFKSPDSTGNGVRVLLVLNNWRGEIGNQRLPISNHFPPPQPPADTVCVCKERIACKSRPFSSRAAEIGVCARSLRATPPLLFPLGKREPAYLSGGFSSVKTPV